MSKDLDKVKAIIDNSGNTFHCKVLRYLHEREWGVLVSPYYNDNISGKPREIDLIAEKAFNKMDGGGSILGTVNVKLFIECKYIPQKTVFWFHNKDKQKAEDLVIQKTPLKRNNSYTKRHHYLEGEDSVAKLFTDERKKSVENEVFYKALSQSLNAMVYYRDKGSIIRSPHPRRGEVLEIVNYPIIVCNSFNNLYRVEIDTDAEPTNITENFQLEVNYAYTTLDGGNNNEYFLIDIVSFDLLESFLEKIEVDTRLFCIFLR